MRHFAYVGLGEAQDDVAAAPADGEVAAVTLAGGRELEQASGLAGAAGDAAVGPVHGHLGLDGKQSGLGSAAVATAAERAEALAAVAAQTVGIGEGLDLHTAAAQPHEAATILAAHRDRRRRLTRAREEVGDVEGGTGEHQRGLGQAVVALQGRQRGGLEGQIGRRLVVADGQLEAPGPGLGGARDLKPVPRGRAPGLGGARDLKPAERS